MRMGALEGAQDIIRTQVEGLMAEGLRTGTGRPDPRWRTMSVTDRKSGV